MIPLSLWVTRWQRDIKAKDDVPQLKVLNSYNAYMGGVDHHDWLAGMQATSLRGKKWYWPLFTRMLDMIVVDAWVIH